MLSYGEAIACMRRTNQVSSNTTILLFYLKHFFVINGCLFQLDDHPQATKETLLWSLMVQVMVEKMKETRSNGSFFAGARCFDHTERMWEERSCSQVNRLELEEVCFSAIRYFSPHCDNSHLPHCNHFHFDNNGNEQVRQWQHWGSGCYNFTCQEQRLHMQVALARQIHLRRNSNVLAKTKDPKGQEQKLHMQFLLQHHQYEMDGYE